MVSTREASGDFARDCPSTQSGQRAAEEGFSWLIFVFVFVFFRSKLRFGNTNDGPPHP